MTTRSATTPAFIHHARVLDVDISSYTLTVASQFLQKPLSSITFTVPYMHPYNGEGIYWMPEVGSVCWVCEPSDGNMPFVLAWGPAQIEGDYRSHRKELNPGDIYLGTRDENFLILRRGGVVQIGATGVCQRIFLPLENIIKDFCQNYGLHTMAGDLEWTIAVPEKVTAGEEDITSEEGKRPALLKLKAKEFSNDPNPIAELEIGSHDGDEKTILSLVIKASGSQGAATKITLKMDKEGSVTWEIQKDFKLVLKEGDYSVETSAGKMLFKAMQSFGVEGSEVSVQAKTGKVAVTGTAGVDITAPLTKVSANMSVGLGALSVLLADSTFLLWVATHVHSVTGPGLNSGPPLLGPPAAVGGSPYVPALMVSKQLMSG